MDGSSKILTVSYGTFSCTLEGFDDPLGAMRDIAEYFRDLAADDRYFGAEPPTPDVDMLQNIAQREVHRRVEARASETGVALRQVPEEATPVEPAPAPKAAPVVQPEPAGEDLGTIAARVVSAAKAVEVDTDVVDEADAAAGKGAPKADTPDSGTGPLTFDDDFLMADEPEDVLAVDPGAQVSVEGPAESVAEKLRRIRAVVSRNIENQANAPVEDAVELSLDEVAKRDRALTETIEQITADLAEDDEEVSEPGDILEEVAKEATPELDEAKPEAEPTAADDTQDQDDTARIDSAARDTSEALWGRDEDAEDDSSVDDLLLDDADLDDEDDEAEEKEAATSIFADDGKDEDEAETAEPEAESEEDNRIRVSKLIGSVAKRLEEEQSDPDDGIEDDLEDAIAATGPSADKDAAPEAQAKSLSEDQDANVGRLLAETDTKLNEDDVVRRRRVISQMRAAVAATKADRLVTRQVPREDAEEQERSPYRNDLSEVVRPATGAQQGTSRPKTNSPPLVLVSSQRVDEEGEDADAGDLPSDFKDFAKTVGAKELPELLEAAAAYTVFGEGHPSFTRPEIMKRVAAVDPTIRMSREESLRSFGQLLRQGKFRKLERGQFTIDQDTRFNPKHRIAGE